MKLNGMLKKVMLSCANIMAMVMVVQTVNSTCVWIVHQPKLPDEINKFK